MSVDAALAAMDTAEQEARKILVVIARNENEGTRYAAILRDRLRLIQRDRETLQRHAIEDGERFNEARFCGYCFSLDTESGDALYTLWPCPDAQAVINHWTENE